VTTVASTALADRRGWEDVMPRVEGYLRTLPRMMPQPPRAPRPPMPPDAPMPPEAPMPPDAMEGMPRGEMRLRINGEDIDVRRFMQERVPGMLREFRFDGGGPRGWVEMRAPRRITI
jgi:hypothetical protein